MWVIRGNNFQKTSDSLEKFVFFICFWQFSPLLCQEQITHITLLSFALFKERLERVAPVAHYKRAAVIDALTLLFKKEQKWDLLKKKSESHFRSFAQKNSSDLLQKLMSEFPTMIVYT